MKTIEQIDEFKRLWTLFLPTIFAPKDAQILLFLEKFMENDLEHGLRRLRSKYAQGGIADSDAAARYLMGVLLNEELRRVGSTQTRMLARQQAAKQQEVTR